MCLSGSVFFWAVDRGLKFGKNKFYLEAVMKPKLLKNIGESKTKSRFRTSKI